MGSCLPQLAWPCQPRSEAPLSPSGQTCRLCPTAPTTPTSSPRVAEHPAMHPRVPRAAQEPGKRGRTCRQHSGLPLLWQRGNEDVSMTDPVV